MRSWACKRNAEREDKDGGNDSQIFDLETFVLLAVSKSRAVAALAADPSA